LLKGFSGSLITILMSEL